MGLQRISCAIDGEKSSVARPLLLLAILYLSCVGSIAALDPARYISQYAHTAWRVQDGVVDFGTTVTQTTDGYLWLGTANGLVRFDGVKFVRYEPPGVNLPTRGYNYLLGARDGSLWIGTLNGLARLRDGKFQWYSNPAQHSGISVILEDHEGTIWATRYRVPPGEGPLCRVEGNGLHCYGKADGIPVKYGLGLREDSLGNLWFGSSVLCRWRPGSGSASTYLREIGKRPDAGDGVVDVAVGPSGTGRVWATTDGVGPDMGVRYFSGRKWASFVIPGFDGTKIKSSSLFVDRDHSLWIGTGKDGLYRVHDGIADHYGSAEGLSGKSVTLIYEDHEGNLWVVTEGGLDMFRDTPVITYSLREGLSESSILAILALQNGSVWIGNGSGIDILEGGRHSIVSASEGLPGRNVKALFQDHRGVVWLGLDNKLMAYAHGRFQEFRRGDGLRLDESYVAAITEDVSQNIWALTAHHRLFRIKDRTAQEVMSVSSDGQSSGFLAPDREGGIWIASRNDTLTYYRDGNARTISLKRQGSSFYVTDIMVDSDNSLLVSTTEGLFRWDNQHWDVLDSRNGLPGDSVFSVLRDNNGALWLYSQRGLVRVEQREYDKWRHQNNSTLAVDVFDRSDGARPLMSALPVQPPATKTLDGRLWFATTVGVQMIDPTQTYRNSIPPPVRIENMIADHKDYGFGDGILLPALTRDLQIDYTALSFVVPQKVLFRYMLEGHDAGWQEPGTRRQAFYNDLRPAHYRFRVIACNNDGVWNEAGAFLEFSIAPAYYQTTWFRVACVGLVLGLLWALYQLRLQQLQRQFNIGLEARVNERTRIARDLHDTLLQSFHGLLLRFQAVSNLLPERAVEAKQRLDTAVDQAAQAITEGRDAVQGLRSSTVVTNDLAVAISALGEELAADGTSGDSPVFRMAVEGTPRNLHPILRDEVYRIAGETLRNAFRHAQAGQIEVEIRYDERHLRLRVRDDGRGIDPDILGEHPRSGHFGLHGMRERAKILGGRLDIWSKLGSGTEVDLSIPASKAYTTSSATRRS